MTSADETREDGDRVVVECTLDAAPEKVWRALTVPELVAEWLEVPPLPGDGSDAGGSGYEIVEAEPFVRLRYAWHDAAGEEASHVVFELAPQPDGRTRFRLTHRLTAAAPAGAANCNGPPRALAA